MPMTREHIRSDLARNKALQLEFDAHLISAREDVATWLDQLIISCHREKSAVQHLGDIADADIETTWDLLQESIARLRTVQEQQRRINDNIADLLAEKVDTELLGG